MGTIVKWGMAATVGAVLCMATPSRAVDWGLAVKIVTVEATYMPGLVAFTADRPVGNCAAGQQLLYTPTGATENLKAHNANAVFSLLLTARIAGQPVTITGNNSNCAVLYVNMQ